jgi:hypothetical protein
MSAKARSCSKVEHCNSGVTVGQKQPKLLDVDAGIDLSSPWNLVALKVRRVCQCLELSRMDHYAQTLVALTVTSTLCLAAWIWARRRLARLSGERQ